MGIELNKANILDNFMDDEELLFESIDLFIDRVASRMGTLQDGVTTRNLDVCMAESHTIKGMVGIFSIGEAFEAAKRLELKMRENNFEGIDEYFADLKTKTDSLVEALTLWRTEGT